MKATKIIYWICTILVIAMMLYSAYGTFFIHDPQGADVMKKIEIPMYLMQFLAVAKILGAIVILVPGYARLKEWAYAGYFFDLAGASYCFIYNSSKFPAGSWAPMLVFVALLLGSYFTYHKLKGA